MPIPKPRKGERARDFVARCAADPKMNEDYPKAAQRVAVCYDALRQTRPGADKPKAASPAACYPKPDETQAQFMSRCQDGGDTEEACIMSWNADKASPPAVERDVQMKWMPALLEMRGLNDGHRTIMGIATTPSVDLMGDVVESMGAKYKEPVAIPLLWMHRHDQPIGTVTHVDKMESGIRFQAQIAKVEEPGILKDRVDEAWQTVRAGLCRGVSIGFTPIKDGYELIKGGGVKYRSWNWHELSIVTVPAQSEATIQVVRSLDEQARGIRQPPAPTPIVSSPQKRRAIQPTVMPKTIVQQDAVVRWINDFGNRNEWQRQLAEPAVRYQSEIQVAKRAAVNARLRQPSGDITREQIRSEIWELRRYW